LLRRRKRKRENLGKKIIENEEGFARACMLASDFQLI